MLFIGGCIEGRVSCHKPLPNRFVQPAAESHAALSQSGGHTDGGGGAGGNGVWPEMPDQESQDRTL